MKNKILKRSKSISIITDLFSYINSKQKLQLALLFILYIGATGAEIFSIAAVVPFLKSLTDIKNEGKAELFGFKIHELSFIEENQLTFYVALIFSLSILIAALIRIINLRLSYKINQEVTRNISAQAYKNLILQPYFSLKSMNRSSLLSSLTAEMLKISDLLSHTLNLIASLTIFLGIAYALFRFDPNIAIALSLSVGTAYLIIGKFSKRNLDSNSKKIRSATISQFRILQESLGSIKDLIINKNYSFFLNLYTRNEEPLRKLNAINAFISSYPRYLIEAISIMILIFISLYINSKEDNFSDVISKIGFIALSCQRLIPAAQYCFSSWAAIRHQSSSIKSILDILSLRENKKNIYPQSKKFDQWKNLYLKDLSFKYDRDQIKHFSKLNYTLSRNSSLGIYGKSGTGKSTLVDLIMSLLKPSDGYIQIDKKILDYNNISFEKDAQAWHDQISHVPQDHFFIDASFAENIALGIDKQKINYSRLIKCAKIAKIDQFILSTKEKFWTKILEGGKNLSGGQKQRLIIARALYKKHSLLILDEPTSALDEKTSMEIIQNLFNLKNNTIIIISHEMNIINKCEKKLYLS